MQTPQGAGIINSINKNVVHRICSGQVVLNLATAVKELVENSLDAGATVIDVRLKDYGSEIIEVLDNGSGVHPDNFQALTLKHHTSKLQDFSDLLTVETFGFRGEALSSLCALSEVSVITRHSSSQCGTHLTFDLNGIITSSTQVARQVGTTVTLKNVFSTVPVRQKEFHRNLKREFAKMVQLLTAYCLVATDVKITCTNQSKKEKKTTFVSTQGCKTVRENISCVFGAKQLPNLMDWKHESSEEDKVAFTLDGIISSCAHGSGRSATDRQYFYINSRPFEPTKVIKTVNEVYHQYNSHQSPFVFLNIKVARNAVDINVTPDKRQVFLNQEKLLLDIVRESLQKLYEVIPSTFSMNNLPTISKWYKESKKTKNEDCNPEIEKDSDEHSDTSSLINENSISNKILENDDNKTVVVEQKSNKNIEISPSDQSKKNNNLTKEKPKKIEHLIMSKVNELISSNDESTKQSKFESKTLNMILFNQWKHGDHSKRPANTECASPVKKAKQMKLDETLQLVKDTKKKDIEIGKVGPSVQKFLSSTVTNTKNFCHENIELEENKKESHCDDRNENLTEEGEKQSLYDKKNEDEDVSTNTFKNSLSNLDEKIELECRVDNSPSYVDNKIENEFKDKNSLNTINSMNDITNYDSGYSSHEASENITDDSNKLPLVDAPCEKETIPKKTRTLNVTLDDIKSLQDRFVKQQTKNVEAFVRFRALIDPENNIQAEQELTREISKDNFAEMEVIGQFNLGFIITRHKSDLFVIDQHASDEKYNFETLQKTTTINSQKLVVPQKLELTAVNEGILIENIEVFKSNGFEFQIDENALPTQRISLTTIPMSKNWTFGKEDVDELLFMLQDSPHTLCRPSRVRAMFASRACRKSVMIGMALTHSQMKTIVLHMGEMDHPWNCPHGRPTMRHVVNLDIYK